MGGVWGILRDRLICIGRFRWVRLWRGGYIEELIVDDLKTCVIFLVSQISHLTPHYISFSLMRTAQPFTRLCPPSVWDPTLCLTSIITSAPPQVMANKVKATPVLTQATLVQSQSPKTQPQLMTRHGT